MCDCALSPRGRRRRHPMKSAWVPPTLSFSRLTSAVFDGHGSGERERIEFSRECKVGRDGHARTWNVGGEELVAADLERQARWSLRVCRSCARVPSPEVTAPLASSAPSDRRVKAMLPSFRCRPSSGTSASRSRAVTVNAMRGSPSVPLDFGRQRTGAAHLRQLRNPPGDRREIAQFDFRLAAQRRILSRTATLSEPSSTPWSTSVPRSCACPLSRDRLASTLKSRYARRNASLPSPCATAPLEEVSVAWPLMLPSAARRSSTLALENAFDSDRRVRSRQCHQHGERQRIEGIVDGELLAGPIAAQAQRDVAAFQTGGVEAQRVARHGKARRLFERERRHLRSFDAQGFDETIPRLALEAATRLERHTQLLAARIELEAMRALICPRERRWPRRTQIPRASRRAP